MFIEFVFERHEHITGLVDDWVPGESGVVESTFTDQILQRAFVFVGYVVGAVMHGRCVYRGLRDVVDQRLPFFYALQTVFDFPLAFFESDLVKESVST